MKFQFRNSTWITKCHVKADVEHLDVWIVHFQFHFLEMHRLFYWSRELLQWKFAISFVSFWWKANYVQNWKIQMWTFLKIKFSSYHYYCINENKLTTRICSFELLSVIRRKTLFVVRSMWKDFKVMYASNWSFSDHCLEIYNFSCTFSQRALIRFYLQKLPWKQLNLINQIKYIFNKISVKSTCYDHQKENILHLFPSLQLSTHSVHTAQCGKTRNSLPRKFFSVKSVS